MARPPIQHEGVDQMNVGSGAQLSVHSPIPLQGFVDVGNTVMLILLTMQTTAPNAAPLQTSVSLTGANTLHTGLLVGNSQFGHAVVSIPQILYACNIVFLKLFWSESQTKRKEYDG
ncbi:hypothetical protein B0H10DRAFT_1943100 [Mycena sp. CBHHK59/15]|nr:hypothetical protein B0H10DRAFT_1943100 [Mycena sp. CBHHK59/15]